MFCLWLFLESNNIWSIRNESEIQTRHVISSAKTSCKKIVLPLEIKCFCLLCVRGSVRAKLTVLGGVEQV